MNYGGRQIYTFGDIRVNLFQRSVTSQGRDLHLRPRSFEVLVYLLQNRDRLITKEELIEKVWKVSAITDDALVKSVVEIRKAIGDDSRHSRFLKTVPKIGYRFIGSVQETSVDPVPVEQIRSIEFEFEEELDHLPQLVSHSVPAERERLDLPGRKARIWLITLLVFLTGAVSFYFGVKFLAHEKNVSTTTVPVLPGKRAVAVAFFDNLTGDPDLDWLREGLAEMLITGLSQSDQLTLLGRQQFYLLLQRIGHKDTEKIRLNEAMEIARRSKAQTLVLGGFSKIGNRIRIDTQLYDAQNGQLKATDHLLVEKPEEILTNIDLLPLKIASRLGAIPGAGNRASEITHVMTNDLNAYRYYSLAVEKANGLRSKEAIDLLQKAIAIDSEFAMAHARIGYAYAVTWNLSDQAKPHLQRAFHLSERLTARDKLYITAWYAIANQDYSSAISSFRKIVNQYPFELEAYTRLAKLLQGEGQYEEAINIYKRGLVIDPEAGEIYNGLGLLYSALGRHEEAIRVHQKFLQLAPIEPNAHDSLGLSYQTAGRFEQAIQQYNQALELKPDFEIAMIHLGNAYFQLGRYNDAIAEYERYIRIAPSNLDKTRGLDSIAYVHWKRGELDLAEKTLSRDQLQGAVVTPVMVAGDRGNRSQIEAMKSAYFRNASSNRGARLNQRIPWFLNGYTLLKTGNKMEAIEQFRKARASLPPIWNYEIYEDCLANAYLESGRVDEAISEYKRVLLFNPNYPLVHFHLARAHEAKGNKDLAHTEYQKFLQVWKDADRDLPQIKTALNRIHQFKNQI